MTKGREQWASRASGLVRGERAASVRIGKSGSTVIDVAYPGGAEYDTHRHEEAYPCLVVRGGYSEWSDRGRNGSIPVGRQLVYPAGSGHAVRTAADGVRMLLVTDPRQRDWRTVSPLALGLHWQLQLAFDDAGSEPDPIDMLHVESLVFEMIGDDDEDGGRPSGGPRSPRDSSGPAGRLPSESVAEARRRDWLDRVRDRLRDARREAVSLTELAADVDRHPAHLARAFRARWGTTPGDLLRRLRVAEAVYLLTETEEPLAFVALDSGFSDQSHMGRWVRRYTGRTPGAFRDGRAG